MKQLMNNIQASVNVLLLVDNKLIGGQLGASLSRSSSPIDITNKINGEWANNLAGIKSWNISCNGLYVKDDEALKLLEQAFMENKLVQVQLTVGDIHYEGSALVINYPLNAIYNSQYRYDIKLLGDGPLNVK